DSEETIPLNLSVSNTQIHNEIENYFDLKNNIKAVHRIGPDGEVALHLITSYESTESGLLLLTNRTLESLRDISYQSSSWDEIKKLLEEHSNLFSSHEEIQEYDYIEWSSIGIDLIQKRKEFREQIDLYKTYDNQHHLLTKLLIDIIEYYLKEYLVLQEHFSKDVTTYTSTNNFYHVLNKHLALYILDYFDISSYSSSPTRYRLINCLVHIVTLLINHPDLHKYQYKGVSYRCLLMSQNDLKYYKIGNHILNRSFVSTSKYLSVAQRSVSNSRQNIFQQNLGHHGLAQISVLLKYTIKLNQTAVDIEHISMTQDENEVLILPFGVFKIKDRIENCLNMCSPILVEIDLEECEDNEQLYHEKEK
ncbi:unnamed protein product, partial [Rotaria sordida]